MPDFPVAHLTIDDVELVIVFVDHFVDGRVYAALQECARSHGLGGDVVAVWKDEFGRSRFIAPPQQEPFFQIIGYEQIRAQVNRILRCAAG